MTTQVHNIKSENLCCHVITFVSLRDLLNMISILCRLSIGKNQAADQCLLVPSNVQVMPTNAH